MASATVPLFFDWLASADGIGWVVAYAAAAIVTAAAHALVRATSETARACLLLTFVAALPISLLGLGLALTALPRVLDQSGGFSTGDVIGFVVYGGVVLVFFLGKALGQVVGAMQAWQRHHALAPPTQRSARHTDDGTLRHLNSPHAGHPSGSLALVPRPALLIGPAVAVQSAGPANARLTRTG